MPNALVVGAMKCGTSALHAYLAAHPDVHMAEGKELNFFLGDDEVPPGPPEEAWRHGHWHRGPAWYAAHFRSDRPVRGESSPGYTDPAHSEVPARMAALVPDARLLYLVRDPVERAVSQYRHHVRDGTEPRPLAEALLDPGSQYVARSRYHERIAPFLDHVRREQLLVLVQERLLADRRGQLRAAYAHVGADPDFWDDALTAQVHVGGDAPEEVPDGLRRALWDRVRDDVERLRHLLDDPLPEWVDPGR
ncbi:sulfotransferase family protein [Nocardioides aurantiacus]|uniref:sulfotransferase family protein n=1 Tax=Nocardioides aurantiacus TaxID=86796 RepID=UPI00403F249A